MEFWLVGGCLVVVLAVVFALTRKMPSPGIEVLAPRMPEPETDIKALVCSCPQWRTERARFRQGDPRRLCAHLCAALNREIMAVPANLVPFSQLISRMNDEKTGIPFAVPTFAFVLGDSGYLITMTAQSKPWATVYVGGSDYSFNVDTGLWDDSGRPPFASDIGGLIQAEVRRRSQKQQDPEAPTPPSVQ